MKKNQQGIALIEALVAAVIVGIGFVAVYGLASTSTRVLMSSIDREKQNMLANMIYEDLLTDTVNIDKYHNMDFNRDHLAVVLMIRKELNGLLKRIKS